MANKFMGYDPELGRIFAEEAGGLVMGFGRSSPRKSEAQARHDWIGEHGRQPSDQELFDAMQEPSSAPPAANDPDKGPLSERFKQMTPQQLGKLFDDLM